MSLFELDNYFTEYKLSTEIRGYFYLSKNKKKITVKVTYGEKTLVECMKNVIKEDGKYPCTMLELEQNCIRVLHCIDWSNFI